MKTKMREKINVWITKDALTRGIRKIEALFDDEHKNMVTDLTDLSYCTQYYFGKDWHRTREAAVARAERMRRRAMLSAEREIKRLKEINFDQEDA